MKKILLFFVICIFSINSTFANVTLSSSEKNVYLKVEKYIENKHPNSLLLQKSLYLKYIKLLDKYLALDKYKDNEKLLSYKKIFDYWLEETNNKISDYNDIYTTKKVTLGYTDKGTPIYAYYRWNPENWYFWIFSNIHWWYEYWTYLTALALKEDLEKNNKTGWFIIPTINPDWLNYYLEWNKDKEFYSDWRVNSRWVDLNRNFCTNNFRLEKYTKTFSDWSSKKLSTWIDWCNSEKETKIIIDTINKYKFNNIISLHSKWNVFYIPDWTLSNDKIKKLWLDLKNNVFKTYDFDPNYTSESQRLAKIKYYEIDEWFSWKYTWIMTNYIWEKYKIPMIIIELKNHWVVESQIYNFKNLLP